MKHDFQSLADLYDYSTKKYAKRKALDFVDGGQSFTYAEFNEACHNLSKLLSNFGIRNYDKIAIFSQNMPNWALAFFSITAFGRIVVPMLTDLTENEVTNILTHSDAKALFVSKRLLPKVSEEMLSRMALVILTDDMSILRANDEDYTCDGTLSRPLSDDIAAIIYTSGTTGSAKGVMLSHRNLCANVLASWQAYRVHKRDRFLSILPMSHAYEMSVGFLYPFACGASVYHIQKPPTVSVLLPAFKKIRPTVILSVPLIIEKVYRNSVIPTVKKSKILTWLKKVSPSILYWLVGFSLKKTFGGKIGFFGIGGAKLDTEVENFLRKAHFPYAIGYGLTETAPLICTAGPTQTRLGSTGKKVKGCQVRLDNVNEETGEGEIVVKGDNVMRGYYKDYSRTQSVLSTDGWFRTGDLAYRDKKGRFYIKGRMGSLILGPSGENIYPEEIEGVINGMGEVNESLVVERKGRLVALVQLNDNVLDWALEGEEKFLENVEEKRKAIMDFVNSRVNKNSNISDVEIQKEPFNKTATQKIRRFLYKEKKD
ncbi:MAG: AMP-binding protein [Bacteroidales bacterium]|nr:AMP-binding protein [Candidatus Cryptobacteroides onthequi]